MQDKDTLYAKIGGNIRFLRKQAELSQENLADKVGLKRASIAQIETGKQAISVFLLYNIGEALGKKVSEILPEYDIFDTYSKNRVEQRGPVLEILDKRQKEVQ
jgi:transcriptional regulator with XRE-family HTH domain